MQHLSKLADHHHIMKTIPYNKLAKDRKSYHIDSEMVIDSLNEAQKLLC